MQVQNLIANAGTFTQAGVTEATPVINGSINLHATTVGTGSLSAVIKVQGSNNPKDASAWIDTGVQVALSGTGSATSSASANTTFAFHRIVVVSMSAGATVHAAVSGFERDAGQVVGGGGGVGAHRRRSALFKPRSSQMGFIANYGSTNAWVKVRAPGKYKSVRVWVLSRGYNTSAGYQAAVAPTDKSGSGSLADSYLPRVGAATFHNVASNANVYGWRNLTWGGNAVFTGVNTAPPHPPATSSGIMYPSASMPSAWSAAPTDHAISSFVKSDWIGVPSVVADDGNFYLLVKIRRNSFLAANGGVGCYEWNASAASSIAASGEMIAVPQAKLPAGDFIADHTLSPSAAFVPGTDTFQTVPFIVEFDLEVADDKLRSIAFVGESHFEGYFIPSTSLANVRNAYPDLVLNYTNWGMSSNRSSEYFTNFDNYLKAGLRVSDVVIHTLSTNDGSDASAPRPALGNGGNGAHEFAQSFAQISFKVDEYLRIGVRPWICLMFYGGGNANAGFYNNQSWISYCGQVRKLCADKGIPLIDVAAGWQYNNAWMPDNVHAGAPGIAHFETRFESAMRAEFGA